MPSTSSQLPSSSERTPLLARARALIPRSKLSSTDILRCILAFWLEFQIGMAEAALGSLLGPMQEAYGISYQAVGFVSLADAAGRFSGSVGAPFGVHHAGLQWMLYISTSILAVSFVINLFAPPWVVVLVALSLAGLASGVLKPSLSTYIAHFHSGPLMSFVYAGEGLGALVQPFLVSGMLSRDWSWNVYYWVPLALALGNIPLAWALFHAYEPPEHEEGADQNSVRRWLKVAVKPVVIYGGILQALAYSSEDIISTWISVFMSDVRGGQESRMQFILSGYWAGEFLSRTFLAGLTHRYGARTLLTIYLAIGAGILVLLQLLTDMTVDGVLVALFGFFLGPVIPTVLTTVSDSVPASMVGPANSVLMAAGVIGSGAAPVLVGVVNSAGGLRWMPLILVGCVIVTGVVWQLSWTVMEKPDEGTGGEEEEADADEEERT